MINKEEILRNLNGEQRKAVLTTEGPVLILAGAGSGKTRVLVHRTAYLIDSGKALPGNILAITFTNKAANEMRERVDSMVGFGSRDIHVSTFHSLCVRILRYDADRLGYGRSFSIYDSDDQLSLMKQIMKDRNMDPKRVNPKAVLGSISSAKNELINNEKYRKLSNSFYGENVSDLYDAYQKALRSNNAMDFDDLIMNTVDLFERFPEVLDIYRERFRYMMVDEYQDTNSAQFRLVSLMAGKYRNLCVVGDDDQSIYRFRGANIRNILDFEKVFPDAAVIRLEQNYRSTKNILDAAYGVISNNDSRKEKRLWTENVTGEKIRLKEYPTGFDEAEGICREISDLVGRKERSYRDFAILYRTNAQSRLFEEKFLMANVPYRIVGGINFYARKEIRDMLAYLKTVDNASDDLMVIRVINTPRRGIGDSTIEKVSHFAGAEGISFYQAACCANDIPGLSKATAKKVAQFADLIGILRAYAEEGSVSGLLKKTAELTGYTAELEREGTEEARGRLENLDELISKAVQYEKNAPDPTLSGFLEDVALIAEVENTEDGGDRVQLMTLHSAKGLEFPCVYMVGMEEDVFPSGYMNDYDEIEEERRLAYVGITRAKEVLTLTNAWRRLVRGEVKYLSRSRFVEEIPPELTTDGRRTGKNAVTRVSDFGMGTDRGHDDAFSGLPKAAAKTKAAVRAKPVPKPKPSPQMPVRASKSDTHLAEGDVVRHKKFGEGTVKEVVDAGKDYIVTVDFNNWGTRKLYASLAKLEKVE